jgi:hypothetical protein
MGGVTPIVAQRRFDGVAHDRVEKPRRLDTGEHRRRTNPAASRTAVSLSSLGQRGSVTELAAVAQHGESLRQAQAAVSSRRIRRAT